MTGIEFARDFEKTANKYLLGTLAGALVGGGAGYLSSASGVERNGETNAERRKRVLRNTLGMALGGGAVGAIIPGMVDLVGSTGPSRGPAQKAVRSLDGGARATIGGVAGYVSSIASNPSLEGHAKMLDNMEQASHAKEQGKILARMTGAEKYNYVTRNMGAELTAAQQGLVSNMSAAQKADYITRNMSSATNIQLSAVANMSDAQKVNYFANREAADTLVRGLTPKQIIINKNTFPNEFKKLKNLETLRAGSFKGYDPHVKHLTRGGIGAGLAYFAPELIDAGSDNVSIATGLGAGTGFAFASPRAKWLAALIGGMAGAGGHVANNMFRDDN